MSTLDFRIAQAAFAARRMERALHDPGPWEISYQGIRVPAVRFIHSDRITFVGHFPEMCWVDVPDSPSMSLLCRGEVVDARPVEHFGDGAFEFRWGMSIAPAQPVSS